MPTVSHVEKHFTATEAIRDVVIGHDSFGLQISSLTKINDYLEWF
jgi:hypothetical protein